MAHNLHANQNIITFDVAAINKMIECAEAADLERNSRNQEEKVKVEDKSSTELKLFPDEPTQK